MTKALRLGTLLTAAIVGAGLVHAGVEPEGSVHGTVRSLSGKPMEGVAVSARADGRTFTTTVYSGPSGEYWFPVLADGTYKMWAQAVGFDVARAASEVQIHGGKFALQNFTLKPLNDMGNQLSGSEWLDSLPETTEADRRGKLLFHSYCTGCHESSYALQNRFDAKGWGLILDFMSNTDYAGDRPGALSLNAEWFFSKPDLTGPKPAFFSPLIQIYKKELVEYLTRVRGPDSQTEYKPLPRPTGESAHVVITEYDLPSGDVPNYYMNPNGTFWTEGVPSTWDANGVHDASICKDGFVYFTDTGMTDNRTIGKLDPRTGHVSSYKLKQLKNDLAVNTHGVICDPDEGVWFTNLTESTNTKFDPKTEQFQRYPNPDSIAEGTGGSLEMDSKGNLWTDTNAGFAKLDPKTGGYTAYNSMTPGGGKYGTAIDREDNIYITQMPFDIIGKLNSRTGKVSEIRLKPSMKPSERNRQLNEQQLSLMATPWIGTNGPRRSATFRTGDYVYFPLYWGNSLAKVNIHTDEVKKFQIPIPHALPYNVMPDRNGMIWISMLNAERIAKFDPATEKFTIYKLPSLGYETRYIDVDNSTDPPSVWVPSGRNNKIARIQFRMQTATGTAAK